MLQEKIDDLLKLINFYQKANETISKHSAPDLIAPHIEQLTFKQSLLHSKLTKLKDSPKGGFNVAWYGEDIALLYEKSLNLLREHDLGHELVIDLDHLCASHSVHVDLLEEIHLLILSENGLDSHLI